MIILLLSLAITTCYASWPASFLAHVVLKPTLHIVETTMPNLSSMQGIYITDVGKYSWAFDEDGQYSFYDGEEWTAPAPIDPSIGRKYGDNYTFYPAYPHTGQSPEAWAISFNGLYHFNGQSWTKVSSVSEQITGFHDEFTAISGYAFIVFQDETNAVNFMVYNPNTKTWSNPKVITHLPSGILISPDHSLQPFSGPIPHAIMALNTTSQYQPPQFILQVNADETYSLTKPQGHMIYSDNNFLGKSQSAYNLAYLSDSPTPDTKLLYNHTSNPEQWKILADAPSSAGPVFGSLNTYNIDNGIVCLLKDNLTNYQTSCTDTNETSVKWAPLLTFNNDDPNSLSSIYARPDGAWIGIHLVNNYTGKTIIYDYTLSNNLALDTNYSSDVKPKGDTTVINPISDHAIFVCNANAYNESPTKPTLSLYDNSAGIKKWSPIDTSNYPKFNLCNLSTNSIAGYHDFWIYQ